MTAAEALRDGRLRARVAAAARTSGLTVRFVLEGWPVRYDLWQACRSELIAEGVDECSYPERTPEQVAAWKDKRQPGRKPCPECARKDARLAELEAVDIDVDAAVAEAVAEWEGVSHGQTVRIEELEAIIVGLRARVAELEAAAPPAPAPAVAPSVAKQAPAPPARLAVVPRERIVTIEMPDGTLATG